MTQNKITIDELAAMVKQGFDEASVGIRGRFDKIEGEIIRVEKKLDFRFDSLQNRLDDMSLNSVTIR